MCGEADQPSVRSWEDWSGPGQGALGQLRRRWLSASASWVLALLWRLLLRLWSKLCVLKSPLVGWASQK